MDDFRKRWEHLWYADSTEFLRIAKRATGSDYDAQDIVMPLLQRLAGKQESDSRAYRFRSLYNAIKTYKRETEKRLEMIVHGVDVGTVPQQIESTEREDDTRAAVAKLPQKYRAVMHLVLEGFSGKDGAKALDISTTTYRQRYRRGLALLEPILESMGYRHISENRK